MRAKKIMLASMAIGSSLNVLAQGAANLAMDLQRAGGYINEATFEVLLPSASDPVRYDVTLQSDAAPSDTLSPCSYLIRWSTETPNGTTDGFSAYYDGNHYRYRNNRLQEYHASANAQPFAPLGPGSQYHNGVHSTAQFVDLLPQYIGLKVSEIVSDTSYIYKWHPDTVVNGRRAMVIDGVKRGDGYDLLNFSYVFDPQTHLPVSSEIESSPGSISEQIVTVTYGTGSDKPAVEITEEGLMAQWPEVFDLYRESTFRAENLVNTPLPSFACQTLGSGERYSHHLNESLRSPMILVLLDPAVATTHDTVEAIRDAIDLAPKDIEVVWAFITNREDDIANVLGSVRPGETALLSANQIARNCGATMYPTVILADRASKVHDVLTGYNQDLGMVVIQRAMLME